VLCCVVGGRGGLAGLERAEGLVQMLCVGWKWQVWQSKGVLVLVLVVMLLLLLLKDSWISGSRVVDSRLDPKESIFEILEDGLE
jgi:hypothetical protein